jgi:hypothetical protein
MNHALSLAQRLLAVAALVLPLAVHADPVPLFVPFEGAGNISVFDAAAGSGGWTGIIEQTAFPTVPTPLSLVSVVLFQLDASTQTLSGSFEFTTTDLVSTLFGTLTGSYLELDILTVGGQFSLDYLIAGGSGAFASASGYGLSFVDFDPAGSFNNYAEAGLLVFSVAEPGTLMLVLGGLGAVGLRRRRLSGSLATALLRA